MSNLHQIDLLIIISPANDSLPIRVDRLSNDFKVVEFLHKKLRIELNLYLAKLKSINPNQKFIKQNPIR